MTTVNRTMDLGAPAALPTLKKNKRIPAAAKPNQPVPPSPVSNLMDPKLSALFIEAFPDCMNKSFKNAEELKSWIQKTLTPLEVSEEETDKQNIKILAIEINNLVKRLLPENQTEQDLETTLLDVAIVLKNLREKLNEFNSKIGLPEIESPKESKQNLGDLISCEIKKLSEKTGGLANTLKPLLEKVENAGVLKCLDEFQALKDKLKEVIGFFNELKPCFLEFFHGLHKKVACVAELNLTISTDTMHALSYCNKKVTSLELEEALKKTQDGLSHKIDLLVTLIGSWQEVENDLMDVVCNACFNAHTFQNENYKSEMMNILTDLRNSFFDIKLIEIEPVRQRVLISMLESENTKLSNFKDATRNSRVKARGFKSENVEKPLLEIENIYKALKARFRELMIFRHRLLPHIASLNETLKTQVAASEMRASLKERELDTVSEVLHEDKAFISKAYQINQDQKLRKKQDLLALENEIRKNHELAIDCKKECDRIYDILQRKGEFASETYLGLFNRYYTDPDNTHWINGMFDPVKSPEKEKK